jgi:release factor glutamine methyltransferase
MNVRQALSNGTQLLRDFRVQSAEIDAELLLAYTLSRERAKLYAHNEFPLTLAQRRAYKELLARRASSEPIAYLLGRKEFYGLPLQVSRHVLIPRPETETIVEIALERLRAGGSQKPRIIDVGTGSGAIALALASNLKKARVTAVDISNGALDVARENARVLRLAQRMRFKRSDLLSEVSGPFDLICANLPYLTNEQLASLPSDIREYEPRLALAGGPDGLYWYERLLRQLPSVSEPGTRLICEIGPNLRAGFEQLVQNLLPASTKLAFHKDMAGRIRVAEVQLASM